MISDPARQDELGMVFPDSTQVRVKMKGEGFRDVILNFAHLFEAALPPEVQRETTELPAKQDEPELVVQVPPNDASTVCVIDSGIQAKHRWLEPAMDAGGVNSQKAEF